MARPWNLISVIALFIALGGTATAAVGLTRDSVGAPEIRAEAVRSPEIRTDAVRAPEIGKGAVRSSELRNEGIRLDDLTEKARADLGGELRIKTEVQRFLPSCAELESCSNMLVIALRPAAGSVPGRHWLIQAKLVVRNFGTRMSTEHRCGLLTIGPSDSEIDEAAFALDQADFPSETATIALTGVVDATLGNPSVALRCTDPDDAEVAAEDMKLTALELGSIDVR